VQFVLLHGYCEGTWVWKDLIPGLEKHSSILAFDLPGFGESAGMPIPLSIEEIGKSIWRVCEDLGFDKPVLVGHSLGGYVALAMASLHPEKPAGLSLFHSTIFADTPEKKLNRDKVIRAVNEYGATPFLKTFSPGLFANPDGGEAQWFSKKVAETPGSSIAAYAELMKQRPDRANDWQKLAFPLLVVAGRKDNIIDVPSSEKAIALNPRAQLEILEKSAHMGMLEEPEKSIAILIEFLSRCKATLSNH